MKLGMEWDRAALVAECTLDEIDVLESDADFMRKLSINDAILEKNLLAKHDLAMDEAITKGSAAAVQWRLERINPGRWAHKDSSHPIAAVQGDVVINLVGKMPDGTEC